MDYIKKENQGLYRNKVELKFFFFNKKLLYFNFKDLLSV